MKRALLLRLVPGIAWLVMLSPTARAQWVTESFSVKPGWTAVYLNVDPSYQSIDELVGSDSLNPISEIWLWKAPASSVQYITSPLNPLTSSSDWAQWTRAGMGGAPNTLSALIPNAAYLIHSTGTNTYTWKVKGKPVAPRYSWTTTGLNFIGFPTPKDAPPYLDVFLSPSSAFGGAAELYQYPGGNLGSTNPAFVYSFHTTRVVRGQAFWVSAGSLFNDYFGPFQVSVGGSGEVALSSTATQYSIYLHNTTTSNLVVTARLIGSEVPPAGQPAITGPPPVLVRGNLNPTNLTYGYAALSTGDTISWTLKPKGQPGADLTVVLGVNRTAMTGGPGSLYAGVLKFTDSLNLSEVNVPVSAQTSSATGLWVGKALASQVGNYLKSYQRDQNNKPVVSNTGAYVVDGINTDLGPVAQSFPLRLIMHNDGTQVVLLQRVFYGRDVSSNLVVATRETALDTRHLDKARRISAADLPWSSDNQPWPFSGQFGPGGTLAATVQLDYTDQTSNPFLHTYHPDHDNRDATFQTLLPQGAESYGITREITLNIDPTGSDFGSLTAAGQNLTGTYLETITLSGLGTTTRDYHVSGSFQINRISPIATLTQP